MKLKICGMKYKNNINAVANLQPDYMGFICYKKSDRYFEDLTLKLPQSIKSVGVFVDEEIEVVKKTIQKYNLNAVQLHGKESPEYCKKLRESYHFVHCKKTYKDKIPQPLSPFQNHKIEIIKVFSIKDKFNFNKLQPYENVCDYYLFDTKGKLPGGNGYTFNWDALKNYPSTKPYFLSGGIGLDEIDNILSFLRRQESKYCYAIDVNSKFEIEAGLKNIDALEKFKQLCHVERM